MKNILKYIFNGDMVPVYFVNILFADMALLSLPLIGIISFICLDDNINYVQLITWCCILLVVMVARLFVLPIFYKILEDSGPNEYTKKFLYNLRYSTKTKIIMLIIAPIPLMIVTGFGYGNSNMFEYFIFIYGLSFISGLLGSYVVLFLYWHILDRKKKSNNTELIEGQQNEQ